MYWEYLKAVLSRALQPTVRVTDGLQILAASASPAVGKLLGIKMTDAVGSDVLAYIGAAAVAFIVIRFFWAPYSLWKEDRGQIATLKIELSKPERMVLEHVSRHRAKAIIKIAKELSEMHVWAFSTDKAQREQCLNSLTAHYSKIGTLQSQAGLPAAFQDTKIMFHSQCRLRLEGKMKDFYDYEVLDRLFGFLHGRLTGEDLGRLLQQDIEAGRRP